MKRPLLILAIILGMAVPGLASKSVLLSCNNSTPGRSICGGIQGGAYPYSGQIFPSSGVITKLYVYVTTAPGAGNSRTYTLAVNNVNSNLIATIADDATYGVATGSVTINAGDVVDVALGTTGTPAASGAGGKGVVFEGTTIGESCLFASNQQSFTLSTSATEYLPFSGFGKYDTELDGQIIIPCSGTIKNLYTSGVADPGSGNTRTFTVRKQSRGGSSAPTSLTTSYVSGESGTKSDVIHSESVVAGDMICLSSELTGTPGSGSYFRAGLTFVADIPGNFICAQNVGVHTYWSTSSARYYWGLFGGNGAITTSIYAPVPYNFTAKAIYVNLTASPGTGTYTAYLNKSTGTTSLLKAITGTDVYGDYTLDTALSTGDLVNIKLTPTSTPNASGTAVTILGHISEATNTGNMFLLLGD